MNAQQWEAFVAGMVYAGGPRAAREAMEAERRLREWLEPADLALTGAELVAEHTGREA